MLKLENSNIYSCFYYAKKADGSFEMNDNTACWAGVVAWTGRKPKEIYIDRYEREETVEYVPILVKELNKITPCSVVEEGNKKYIKFQLLPTYNQSLVLLNFIRNLWHNPKDYNWKNKDMNTVYFHVFFETLKKSRYKDGLKRLTTANKKACEASKAISAGHSNMHPANLLKVKDSESLLSYKGQSTDYFLTT